MKDADGWYWARNVLFFAIGGVMAAFLSFLSLAAWYSANPGIVATDAWQPMLRFIISGTGTAPWVIGIIACVVIGVRTSRPMKRTIAAVIAAAVVLGLEVLAMTGYLALLSYYCA